MAMNVRVSDGFHLDTNFEASLSRATHNRCVARCPRSTNLEVDAKLLTYHIEVTGPTCSYTVVLCSLLLTCITDDVYNHVAPL